MWYCTSSCKRQVGEAQGKEDIFLVRYFVPEFQNPIIGITKRIRDILVGFDYVKPSFQLRKTKKA
jgi:hypothetical protein